MDLKEHIDKKGWPREGAFAALVPKSVSGNPYTKVIHCYVSKVSWLFRYVEIKSVSKDVLRIDLDSRVYLFQGSLYEVEFDREVLVRELDKDIKLRSQLLKDLKPIIDGLEKLDHFSSYDDLNREVERLTFLLSGRNGYKSDDEEILKPFTLVTSVDGSSKYKVLISLEDSKSNERFVVFESLSDSALRILPETQFLQNFKVLHTHQVAPPL